MPKRLFSQTERKRERNIRASKRMSERVYILSEITYFQWVKADLKSSPTFMNTIKTLSFTWRIRTKFQDNEKKSMKNTNYTRWIWSWVCGREFLTEFFPGLKDFFSFFCWWLLLFLHLIPIFYATVFVWCVIY